MQNIISTFINGAISAYMVEVKHNDISGSLTQKNLDISQLELFPDALLQHGIPLLIRKGTIKNVSIQMPTKFKTDPIILTVESVTFLCEIADENLTPEMLLNMKKHMFKSYKVFRKCYKLILGLISNHSILSIFRTIMSNIIMEIKNIHIHIEYSTKINSTPKNESKSTISNPKNSNINANSDEHSKFDEKSSNNQNSNFNQNSQFDENSLSDSSYDDSIDIDDFLTESRCRVSSHNEPKNLNEKVTSIGIVIKKLVVHNPDDLEKVSNKKIIKEAVFTDFGLYIDADQNPVDFSSKEKCEEELLNLYNSKNHNWIIKPLTFSGFIKFIKDDPRIFFEPNIEKIVLNIKEDYIPLIFDLLKSLDLFQKKYSVAHIQKPSSDDPQSNWVYCHKCAVSKISNASFDFSKNLSLLLKRRIFLKNYKKKNSKSIEIIEEMQRTLDYSTIIAFRAAYRLIHKKRKEKVKSKITAKTTKKINKEIKNDPIHIVTKIVTNFALNFTGGLLTINLKKKSGKKHISLDIKNIHFMIEKDLKSYLIHASASYECVKYKKEKEIVVFKSIDNDQVEMKLEMIIPFLSYSNWSISLKISRNNYTFNLNGLLQLISDLCLSNLFSSDINQKDIIDLIKSKNILINIQVLSSIIKVIGSKNNRAVQYAFENLSFTTDPKTLEKTLKFNNSWISLITDTEAKISSDFSLNGTLNENKVALSIPLFSCSIPFKYIVVIQDFINIFMSYQDLFRINVFPKIKINFVLELKGMNINIKPPNSNQSKNLQIRDITLKFKNSMIKFRLKTITMSSLLSLKNLKAIYNQQSLDFKINEISTKVMDLLALVPKDALQIIKNQNNDNQIDADTNSDCQTDNEYNSINLSSSQEKNFELPKIKIGLIIENFIIELSITNNDFLNLYIKNINASIDKNKFITCAFLDRVTFEDLIISKQISYQSEVIFDQITEITLQTNDCNLNINKNLILLLLKTEFPAQEIALPHDVGINLSFKINQMSISDDFIMQNFSSNLSFINSKINLSIGMDSVSSSIVKFKSNDVLQMEYHIKKKLIDLAFNLEEIQIYIIPLVDIISFLSMSNPPSFQNILIVKINPIKFSFCFGEDNVNVIFDSPFKLKLDTYQKIIPYVYLKIHNFSINLNDDEIIRIQKLKFVLDTNIVIKIPTLYITVSMVKIYKLLKMISIFTKSSFAKKPKKILINEIPIDSIAVNAPFIQVIIHQTKSRRCVTIAFDSTEFYLKNTNQKSKMLAQTSIHFIASDGFTSKQMAQSFKINAIGEISENSKNCYIKSENPIKFEVSTSIINQILKNITATEDEILQPYSIMNNTGVEITIFINKNQYYLKQNESIPHITKFAESDINVKIGNIVNPIQICSSFSKISFPLFFGNYFILVWLDPKKLQLRLLSPISFKNRSNVDLTIQFCDQTILLHKNETFYVNYKIEKIESIIIKNDKEQQKIDFNEKSVIKFPNKFIKVSRNRKIDTLHTIISFETPYYFRNELISFLTMEIRDGDGENIEFVTLEPCKIVPIPFFTPSTKIISFEILDTNEIKGVHVDLNLDLLKNDKQFILTNDKNGNKFTLQFTYSKDELNLISISPFIIYFNSLLIPLIFSLSPYKMCNEDILNLNDSIPTFFQNENSQDVYKFDKPIMVSPMIEDYNNISIYITSKYSKQDISNQFLLTDFEKSNDLKIQIDDDKVSLIHCHVSNNSSILLNTFIFFIAPKYFLHNQTNETFLLNLFDDESIKISPNSYLPVTFIRESLDFSIAIEPKLNKKNLIFSNSINLEKINSQYIKVHPLDSPVLLSSSIEKETHYITFLLNRTLPYLFINNTNYKIVFIQKNTADSSHTVMPYKTLPFYIFDENMPTIIYCEIKDQISFEIDVNQLTFPEKIQSQSNDLNMNLYYYVDISSNEEGSTITLSNVVNNTINIPKYLNSTSTEYKSIASHFGESLIIFNVSDISKLKDDVFNLTLDFDLFSFLIITTQNQELCRITLKDIKINSSLNDFVTKTQVTFGTIKIDDQNKYAIYPSILQILPNGNEPAICLAVNSFGCNKYGKIELNMRPIIIRIDLSFVSDFIGELFYYESNNQLLYDNDYSNMKFEINDISLSEIIHNLMPKQIKYHINNIIIHPFIINVSFHTITMRSNHPFQTKYHLNHFINFIPSFDELTISINNLHCFQNLSGTSYEIVYKISNDIKRMIFFQLSIKNPILKTKEKIESFFHPEIIQQLKKGVINKASSIISFIEASLFYISSLLDIYTDSPPKIRSNEISIYRGLLSFISSFKEGIEKLFEEPKKRGNINGKNYFCGYIFGTGIGLLKCAANITSGFCYLSASFFSSSKRIFTNKKPIFIENRECEPSLGMNCSDNEYLLWYTYMTSSGLIEVYTNSLFISNEKTLIKRIESAEIENISVIIYDNNHKKYVIKFNDENQAIFFFNVIQSQLFRTQFFDVQNED